MDELMETSCFVNNVFSRLKVEVIGVAEENLCTKLKEIIVGYTSHGASSSYGHKEWSLDRAMCSGERSAAASGGSRMKNEHLYDVQYRGTSACEIFPL